MRNERVLVTVIVVNAEPFRLSLESNYLDSALAYHNSRKPIIVVKCHKLCEGCISDYFR